MTIITTTKQKAKYKPQQQQQQHKTIIIALSFSFINPMALIKLQLWFTALAGHSMKVILVKIWPDT